ncbi:MAG: GWxTD domain-containing protein [Bacteroidota bacterium]
MKKIDLHFLCATTLLAIMLISCNSKAPYRSLTKSITYNHQSSFSAPITGVYHINDSCSRIFFTINTGSLLYIKKTSGTTFAAHYRAHYELHPFDEPNNLQDSGTFEYSDTLFFNKTADILDSFDIGGLRSKKYTLNLTITDLNKKSEIETGIVLLRDDPHSRQNFCIRSATGALINQEVLQPGQDISVTTNNKNLFRLCVRYYRSDYPIALPPFLENRELAYSLKPDSAFLIDLENGTSTLLRLKSNSIYHFQSDTTQKEGLTLFTFYEGFPKVTTAEQMLAPVRYISTKNEFNDLKMMKNAKHAVDEFWLDKAGTVERAKEMIVRYYNRVQDANKYFTSYLEGWKSDRGMIYIVFGPPQALYKSATQETWVYGEDRNILSTTFTFNKVNNQFSDNDYSLERSAEYKDTWYTAVETWRK